VKRPTWLHRRPDPADYYRDDYLTVEQHREEAERLLWVIDGELQSDAPRTLGDLAVIALAHILIANPGSKL
jgi:hypothetical protein